MAPTLSPVNPLSVCSASPAQSDRPIRGRQGPGERSGPNSAAQDHGPGHHPAGTHPPPEATHPAAHTPPRTPPPHTPAPPTTHPPPHTHTHPHHTPLHPHTDHHRGETPTPAISASASLTGKVS